MKSVRVLVFVLLALALLLIGCSKQEAPPPSPSPSPTATPPSPKASYCASTPGGDVCTLTSDQIADEESSPDHSCEKWDDAEAIHITGHDTVGPNEFHTIKVTPGPKHPRFDISVEACPGSSGKPFPSAANNGQHNGWDSKALDKKTKNGSHYHLILTDKATGKKSDPHIVISGTS